MPKAKAPEWLRLAFRDGVDEREADSAPRDRMTWPVAGPGINVWCYLGHHDERQRPCSSGPLERAHLIPRQRVENALGGLLPWGAAGTEEWNHFADLILLAAWDPRNGVISCQDHHRRWDGHACSPEAPEIVIPRLRLPSHFFEFIREWGLESQAMELPRFCPPR